MLNLNAMTMIVGFILLLISMLSLVLANDIPFTSGPSVVRVPGDRYFLLTPAPLRQVPTWGLDNIPYRALFRMQIPLRDINQFDYSLPAKYRRVSANLNAARQNVRYGQEYVKLIERQVHKHYSARFGQQIQVVLGAAGQQYMFDARQALLLHEVQKGLRKVSTTVTLDETPLDDPVENVRLRAILESSFESYIQSPHMREETYPRLLELALLKVKEQQKSEVMYKRFPSIFDGNWNVVFPFLRDSRIDMVKYLLRSS